MEWATRTNQQRRILPGFLRNLTIFIDAIFLQTFYSNHPDEGKFVLSLTKYNKIDLLDVT